MQAKYRSDYEGEFVILETKWTGGKKQQKREWIPNPITNTHISGRAACIGHEINRDLFNFTILQRHRGGLLGSKKLQTYGTGDIAKHMRLDFVVETDPNKLQELKGLQYHEQNIVYTTPKLCITHPGDFYTIPHNPRLSLLALIPYLAAFDNHREVFLIGYNTLTPSVDDKWIQQLTELFKSYSNTKFYSVGRSHLVPKEWKSCSNFETMEYRPWISYCDV